MIPPSVGPFPLVGPWPEPAPSEWCSIYRLYDSQQTLLYIGSSFFPGDRLSQHTRRGPAPFMRYARFWTYEWYRSPAWAVPEEKRLIRELEPVFNNERGQRRRAAQRRGLAPRQRRSRLELISRPIETGSAQRIAVVDVAPVSAARTTLVLPSDDWRELYFAYRDGIKIEPRIRTMLQWWRHHPRTRSKAVEVARRLDPAAGQDSRRTGVAVHRVHHAELAAAAASEGLPLKALLLGIVQLWRTEPRFRAQVDSTARRLHGTDARP